MGTGILETLEEALARLERKVDRLAEDRGHRDVDKASIADLAVRYSCAKSTVRCMLHQMAAAGLRVRTYKQGSEWRVSVPDFDAAYEQLFSQEFSGL